MASGSIQRKLQWGFALSALLVLGGLAIIVEWAVRHSFQREDAQVLLGQAESLSRRLGSGRPPEDDLGPRPEKAEWIALDARGKTLHVSAGAHRFRNLPWPQEALEPLEVFHEGARLSILVRPLPFRGQPGQGQLRLAMDRSHETELIHVLRWTLAGGCLLMGALGAFLGRIIAGWGLAPLQGITRQAGSIDYGHLDTRLSTGDFPRELTDLVDTLNEALGRLQIAFDRLNQLGSELAHELRTPLQNIRAEVEALVLRPKEATDTRDTLGSVLEECDRMASLIEQVLLLARTEHPGAAIQRSWIPIHAFLVSVLSPFVLLAEEGGVHLQVEVPNDFQLQGDPTLLRRALGNLLANALRHTPAGGSIRIRAEEGTEGPRILVSDTGSGIPATLLPRLGQRFERGPHTREHLPQGYGLGLAIVKGILHLHGGHVAFESHEGQGTTITLGFPPREA